MNNYQATLNDISSRQRRWLVTGAAGFIGSHLVETLLKLGQEVVALDNFSTGRPRNLEQVRRSVGPRRWSRLRFIEGDIRYRTTCDYACKDVDVVLHQAALGSVVRSIENPAETDSTNISGFLNMLLAVKEGRVGRMVYAASSSTYGDSPHLPRVESVIGNPLSPYALTKYVNELYADVFARCYGTEVIGLRYFNVFGPRQDPEAAYAAVIPKWISSLLSGAPVEINGDGLTSRDFCYVDNVVQANLLAATVDDPAAVNQVYNVACGEQISLNDLYDLLRRKLALHDETILGGQAVYRDFRIGDIKYSQADISKAKSLLGYQPDFNVERGLGLALPWYMNELDGPRGKPQKKLRGLEAVGSQP